MTHQTDEAREEALRLAKEAGLIIDGDWNCSLICLADFIALARASQAQPEPLAQPKTILERAYEAVKSTKPPAPPNWKQPAEPPAAPVQQEPK